MTDQLKQIRPLYRVPSGKYKDGNPQSSDLVDQLFAFIRAEFHGVPVRLCGGATVHAGQVAGLSYFPNGDERAFVKIDCIDLRVHESIRQYQSIECSDQSLRLIEFAG